MKVIRKGKNRFVFSEFPHELTLKKLGIKLSELTSALTARIELFEVWTRNALNNGLDENRFEVMYDFSIQVSLIIEQEHINTKSHE